MFFIYVSFKESFPRDPKSRKKEGLSYYHSSLLKHQTWSKYLLYKFIGKFILLYVSCLPCCHFYCPTSAHVLIFWVIH